MSAISKIEWTDRTWNPIRGCSVVSPGCVNCYAMKQAHRFSGPGKAYEGLTKQTSAGPQWTGTVRLADARTLMAPYRWRTPSRIFVNSMSDLFHESLSNEDIAQVFHVMYGEASAVPAPAHTYQILTKRPKRMLEWFNWLRSYDGEDATIMALSVYLRMQGPHPRVWLGVSAEDQQRADERIPHLLQTPAAVRFVSAEPLLGPIDLRRHFGERRERVGNSINWRGSGVDWVIVGGESGAGARPCDVRWVRSIVEQCRAASVPVFVKQLGADVRDRNDAGFLGDEPDHWPEAISFEDRVEHDLDGTRDGYQGAPVRIHLRDRKGGKPAEWPEDLRVREFPKAVAA